MKTLKVLAVLTATLLFASQSWAQEGGGPIFEIVVSPNPVTGRPADNVPDATSYDLFITTDDDIVSYEDVTMVVENGALYQFQTGLLGPGVSVDFCPTLGVSPGQERYCDDSFLTTPGETTVLVNDGSPPMGPDGIPLSTWADLVGDGEPGGGPVENFYMARFTLVDGPADATANARLNFKLAFGRDPTNPVQIQIPLGIPEPASAALAGLAGLMMLGFRRRR